MIFFWMRAAAIFLLTLIIPPPPRRTRIDPSAPCPACGSEYGEIETVEVGRKIVVQHHCDICKCYWYEEPIRTDVAIRASTTTLPPTKA